MPSHDSETPANGHQVITANALLHRQENDITKVFLAKRAATKKFLPNIWELPGGHIDFGEDIIEGLKREVREEFAVRIKVGDPFAAFTYTNQIKGSHSIEVEFFAEFEDPIESIQIDPEDHSEARFVSEEEFKELQEVTPEERKVIEKAFALLRGEPLAFS